jgi:isopenicillin N synthase-like dioxygenase
MAEQIPVIDVAGVLAGRPGTVAEAATQLRHAYERIGFWFMAGHDVPQALIDATFAEARRFHALPLETKLALKANRHNVGYLPLRGSTTRHSTLNANNKPNLLEGFLVKRDLPADHPDVLAGKLYRGMNQWPDGLPGFRETCVAYCDAVERLAKRLLPVYAAALDLPEHYFDPAFVEPQYTLRLAHYPRQDIPAENEFGIAPHTDSTFMTLLAQNDIPGLQLLTQSGDWIEAPVIPGTFVVNSGELLKRWTNERFLATPHRVINRSGSERFSIPFFFDASIDHRMECLPSCHGPGNPPKYDPITYAEYQAWFQRQNYDHIRAGQVAVSRD